MYENRELSEALEVERRDIRTELEDLHRKYKFARVDRENNIPEAATSRRVYLSGLLREITKNQWLLIPSEERTEIIDKVRKMKRAIGGQGL